MGQIIHLQLEDEEGKRIDNLILDCWFLPSYEETDFPLLRFVDPDGDTIFNGLQMVPFLEEWERLKGRLRTPEDHVRWENGKRLAHKCNETAGTFLRFVGD